jgi:hypothetical protein
VEGDCYSLRQEYKLIPGSRTNQMHRNMGEYLVTTLPKETLTSSLDTFNFLDRKKLCKISILLLSGSKSNTSSGLSHP